MEAKAEEAARVFAALANARRLVALCHVVKGEKPVAGLTERFGLAPSALSQDIAQMRDLRLFETQREDQMMHCRLASPKVADVLATLYRLYCSPACSKPEVA